MNAERVRKTWRLLFLEEQMGEMTHKPQQSQEPQHLRCGVITTSNVEALGVRKFHFHLVMKNGPEVCYWQLNSWNLKTGTREGDEDVNQGR